VYCHSLRSPGLSTSPPLVSPDGSSIAYYEQDRILRVARLGGVSTWTDYQADLGTFARFGSDIRSGRAFAWASDSTFLWTATHEALQPSRFPATPMQPVATVEDGSLRLLPPLRHDAGPLDALLWVGGDGLAVAQFGTRGGFYRPKRDNPAPTFGIVNAQQGSVLDTLPFAAIEPLEPRLQGSAYVKVRDAAATKLPDGRVRVLLSVGQWVVWTQGELPRVMADPYVADRHNQMALSSDGTRVLVGRMLRTEGGMCGRTGGCRPGTPVEGILAALHDLATGQLLWSIRATVTNDYEFPGPAISPDGRYALVGLVPTDTGSVIALISMSSGEVIQTVPSPGGRYAMGFARDGLSVWTHAYGVTAVYDVGARAQ
jgi:hypothetical protein